MLPTQKIILPSNTLEVVNGLPSEQIMDQGDEKKLIALMIVGEATSANYGQLILLLYRSSFVLRLIARLRWAEVRVYFPLGPRYVIPEMPLTLPPLRNVSA